MSSIRRGSSAAPRRSPRPTRRPPRHRRPGRTAEEGGAYSTQIYCATSNPGKLAEFRLAAEAVPDAPPVLIDLLPGFAAIPPCVEDGATFEENALIKARHYGRHTAGLLFADDSGLVVDALHGAPGVHSARFSGPGATNRSNNGLLLEKLRGIEHRTAAFVCAIALVKATEPVGVFTGRVEGVILDEPRGANGFGYCAGEERDVVGERGVGGGGVVPVSRRGRFLPPRRDRSVRRPGSAHR